MNTPQLQRATFLLLLAAVTVGFAWILLPFFGAVMWAVALAILFTPIYKRLDRRLGGRRNLAALVTLLAALVIVILPVGAIAASVIDQVAQVAQRMRSGEFSFAGYFDQVLAALPQWAHDLLTRYGLGDLQSIFGRLNQGLARVSQQIAGQAVNIGQNAFQFLVSFGLMLYMLYFLLRDGAELSATLRNALPLGPAHTRYLLARFATVIRATIKGNVVVALVQGFIGGVSLWALGVQGGLLWGTVMAFLSLLPAVGAAMVWGPVAIYFLATGAVGKGIVLIAIGVFVIGLVDNVLRPLLVGKDTQIPDYIVLMSTVGGLALFGINGFVLGPVVAAMFMAAWSLFMDADTLDDGAPPQP